MNNQDNNIGIPNMMPNNNSQDNGFSIPGSNLQPIGFDSMEKSINEANGVNNNVIPTIVTGDNNNTIQNNGIMPSNNNQTYTQNNNVGVIDNTRQSNPLLDDTPFTNETFNDNSNIILVKDYLKYLLLIFILPIGFIVYLVKIFNKNENKNIKNLSKALLLFSIILVVVLICIYFIFIRI